MEAQKNKREEAQRIMMEMEMQKRQLDSIKEELRLFESNLVETRSTTIALDALKENKKGSEILVSIGSDTYMKAEIKDTEKVLTTFGAGVSIEKNTDDAKKIMQERIEEVMKAIEKLQKAGAQTSDNLAMLEDAYRRIIAELQKAQ